jgi:hypothetical protein
MEKVWRGTDKRNAELIWAAGPPARHQQETGQDDAGNKHTYDKLLSPRAHANQLPFGDDEIIYSHLADYGDCELADKRERFRSSAAVCRIGDVAA